MSSSETAVQNANVLRVAGPASAVPPQVAIAPTAVAVPRPPVISVGPSQTMMQGGLAMTLLGGDSLTNYRDYLRTIFTGPTNDPNYATYKAQLESRFHQDFETTDDGAVPANQLLIPIVTNILTSATGAGYGYGIAAGSINPQGQMTNSDYLDYLIGLTKLSADQLGLLYRLNLQRPDSAQSTPVQENVSTLQRFYTDSFQSPAEANPIIPAYLQGKAPYFLEYGEWLMSQQPFYGENFYMVRQFRVMNLSAGQVALLQWPSFTQEGGDNLKWFLNIAQIDQKLSDADQAYSMGEYDISLQHYNEALAIAQSMESMFPSNNPNTSVAMYPLTPSVISKFAARKTFQVANSTDVGNLLDYWIHNTDSSGWVTTNPQQNVQNVPQFTQWFTNSHDAISGALIYLQIYVLPICFGDVALATGDYATAVEQYGRATRFVTSHANASDQAGYAGYSLHDTSLIATHNMYSEGTLPYSADLNSGDGYPDYGQGTETWVKSIAPYVHPVELAAFRLRHASAMLEWADFLYRSDDASNIARARELYKDVLWMYGEFPPIIPPQPFSISKIALSSIMMVASQNPAISSQKARAQLGFSKIEQSLNYYGYSDDLVPTLRYKPLKAAADAYASAAKSAQTDFLNYMGQVESQIVQNLGYSNMVKKAALQSQVATQQVGMAQDDVKAAQMQLSQVNDSITAAQSSIADQTTFWNEFTSYIGGVINVVKGLPGDTTSAVASGLSTTAGITADTSAGTISEGGMLGLGAGAGAMAGFGVFAVASYMSLESMASAISTTAGTLSNLLKYSLPAAQTQLDAKTREVGIAALQQQIAQSDASLAQQLVTFQSTRFLNLSFWVDVANVLKTVMRGYVDLAAKTAWFAERALSYEQGQAVNIVRFDYFPLQQQDVTGADLLQLDLADLEAAHLSGETEAIPIRQTFSMARDFPLQFGQLKSNNTCTFSTRSDPLRYAHPGTYNHRVRAVTVTAATVSATPPPRGLLTNAGYSQVTDISNGTEVVNPSIRPPDALPLSEFNLSANMAVYGLPNDTLMPFEGSGVDTSWTLEFPPLANPYGLGNLADVLLTFDVIARYSPQQYQVDIASLPTTVERLIMVSGLQYQPAAIKSLVSGSPSVTISFDLTAIGLPANETGRKVNNLVVFVTGGKPLNFSASFSSATPPNSATVPFQNSVALSNSGPLYDGKSPPSPLNAFVGDDATQAFSLTINRADNPGVDFGGVIDIVLGVDYSANLS